MSRVVAVAEGTAKDAKSEVTVRGETKLLRLQVPPRGIKYKEKDTEKSADAALTKR